MKSLIQVAERTLDPYEKATASRLHPSSPWRLPSAKETGFFVSGTKFESHLLHQRVGPSGGCPTATGCSPEFRKRDRQFESCSLQRGVHCEPVRPGGCRPREATSRDFPALRRVLPFPCRTRCAWPMRCWLFSVRAFGRVMIVKTARKGGRFGGRRARRPRGGQRVARAARHSEVMPPRVWRSQPPAISHLIQRYLCRWDRTRCTSALGSGSCILCSRLWGILVACPARRRSARQPPANRYCCRRRRRGHSARRPNG